MSRHYWPEPPKDGGVVHLVEHKSGSRTWWNLLPDGEWVDSETGELRDNAWMESQGFIGVLKPFDEEAERAAFCKWAYGVPDMPDNVRSDATFLIVHKECVRSWLAAVRHERGL